jgi:hypothetical protein
MVHLIKQPIRDIFWGLLKQSFKSQSAVSVKAFADWNGQHTLGIILLQNN